MSLGRSLSPLSAYAAEPSDTDLASWGSNASRWLPPQETLVPFMKKATIFLLKYVDHFSSSRWTNKSSVLRGLGGLSECACYCIGITTLGLSSRYTVIYSFQTLSRE
jgi:hypothetical protein